MLSSKLYLLTCVVAALVFLSRGATVPHHQNTEEDLFSGNETLSLYIPGDIDPAVGPVLPMDQNSAASVVFAGENEDYTEDYYYLTYGEDDDSSGYSTDEDTDPVPAASVVLSKAEEDFEFDDSERSGNDDDEGQDYSGNSQDNDTDPSPIEEVTSSPSSQSPHKNIHSFFVPVYSSLLAFMLMY